MIYNLYIYDPGQDAVIMTDMDGRQLVIECKRANAQVIFDDPSDELGEKEFFCLISLFHQDCFLMISDIIKRYENRFLSHRDSFLKEIDFSECFQSRLTRMENAVRK